MAQYDLDPAALREYRPPSTEAADFDEFWSATIAEARQHDLAATFTPVDSGLAVIETLDVTFAGACGNPVKAWLHLPVGRSRPLPVVVEYLGYGGGRGLAHERTMWAAAGYAHLVMDTRGQGSGWALGETPDLSPDAGQPSHPGYMTRGIGSPEQYYYRRVFTDGVRAVEAARSHEAVDPNRVFVTGGSQGGGITLAVSALVDDLAGVLPDVPFLCDFPRATTLIDSDPYGEIVRYLKVHRDQVDRVYRTLSYFDGCAFAARANAPALFSVALMDQTCPPSTVYGAYNRYAGEKQICVYPFNDHEGGQGFHDVAKMRWVSEVLA